MSVVPLFSAQGLTADIWGRAQLEALLDKHPEIHRSFFDNDTRAFLSVPEVREQLPLQEPFLERNELGEFFGRDAELAEVGAFLASSNLFLVVHGAGGIGKTRLLVEAGEQVAGMGVWQVLWANVASMMATGAWFEAIVPERPTLLMVDEPPDEVLLQQLAEQLGGGRAGRTSQWKIVVAVRSPKDPVLRFLFGPRMKRRVRELAIEALQESSAEGMCRSLLSTGVLSSLPSAKRDEAAREFSRRFSRHPVWLTLAVHLLEKRGHLSDVPATANDLAESYLREVFRVEGSKPDAVRDLLRWVALIGTVNRTDDATIKLLGDGSDFGDIGVVRRELASLVSRKALVEWGALNRFVEIKPDVLRDHLLVTWLCLDTGFGVNPKVPSEAAKKLLAEVSVGVVAGTLSGVGRAILRSLARVRFLLRLSSEEVPLLDQLFADVQGAIEAMTASHRLALVNVLETIAGFEPLASARTIRGLRLSVAPDETVTTIFKMRTIGQDDVLLALAWPLFLAAMGAQTPDVQEAVLEELCAITEAEADLALRSHRGLPNDGKRAAALVSRVLAGGPQFWGDFDIAAKTLGERLLNDLAQKEPTAASSALLKALVQSALSVERQQTWSDDHAFHMQTVTIGPDHPAWATREVLLGLIKQVLTANTTPTASRVALWQVLAEAHRNVSRACKRDEPLHGPYYESLLGDLVWARTAFGERVNATEELSAARDLWNWHHQYEKDPTLKAASDVLETLYLGNELAAEFEPLLSRADYRQREPRAKAKAADLANRTAADIAAFVDRAMAFLGERDFFEVNPVGYALGVHAPSCEAVRSFAESALLSPDATPRTDFAALSIVAWVASVRMNTPKLTGELVRQLVSGCGSDHHRLALLGRLYSRGGDLTTDEHELLRAARPLFVDNGQAEAFVAATARTLHYNWPTLKTLLEEVLGSIPPATRAPALRLLIESVNAAVHGEGVTLPPNLGTWLLDQLLPLPDLDDLGGNVEWYLDDTLKIVGRVSLPWLAPALAVRSARELMKREAGEECRALGYHVRLSKYVKSIAASDATNQSVLDAASALLNFAADSGTVAYYLPEILRDIDPEGFVIPNEVAARLLRATTLDDAKRLARIGGAYALGSPPWRKIAKAALSVRADPSASDSLFPALADRGIRSYSARPGEVPAVFVSAVENAKSALNSEGEASLRPFWEWRLANAEAELRNEQEQAKEERGE